MPSKITIGILGFVRALVEEWMTWEQAARLVGCPVPTIDWYARQDRIERRPRVGARPSLRRTSVEEFATWWQERERARGAKRAARAGQQQRAAAWRARAEALGLAPGRTPPPPPEPGGWLTTNEAAAILGVNRGRVVSLARDGRFRSEVANGRWWLHEHSLRAYVEARDQWVSTTTAAAMVGCSPHSIMRAVKCGSIEQRLVESTAVPSLRRDSVEEFAATWKVESQARAQRRTARQPAPARPPEDEHVWLDATTTGLVLNVTRTRVGQLARTERLRSTAHQGQRWFRRDHVEQFAAARSFSARAKQSRTLQTGPPLPGRADKD